MTIAGVASGSSIRPFAAVEVRERHRVRPSASATPSGVAISTVKAASRRLFVSASRRLGSCQTEPIGSCQYQRNEKPCQAVRDRPELNDNWTAMTTGIRVHKMYSQVNAASPYGRRQVRSRRRAGRAARAGGTAEAGREVVVVVTTPPGSRGGC